MDLWSRGGLPIDRSPWSMDQGSIVELVELAKTIVVLIFLILFFFGRNPSKINVEDPRPLETNAVRAAQGPGMQIVFNLFDFTSLTRFSPGSQMLGIPASLTKAIESPLLR